MHPKCGPLLSEARCRLDNMDRGALQDGWKEKRKKRRRRVGIHCVGARQMAGFLRGIDRFHAGSSWACLTTGDYGRKQIKAELGFASFPTSELNTFCAHLSATLGCNCKQTILERTDSIYRSAGTCLHFKVVANLLSMVLNGSSLMPVAPPCDNNRHLISSDLTSLSSPSLYTRLLHPHNHNYTIPDG